MTEQKEIADVVLDTPEPDRFVDCGESRPLPMFHMHTLMQYGERCAEAALAWLRSQGEPVAFIGERDGMLWREQADAGDTPLFLAPRTIENDDREYLSAIAHLGRAMRRLVIAARTSGGTAGPDAELMAACAQAEDAMSVGAIGRAMEAPQPAIPDGWREAIESISEFGDDTLCDEALHAIHASRENTEEALRIAVRLTKEEAIEKLEKLAAAPEPSK